ncbi:MAG: DUF1232 domain-containing protein [Sandaracinaceae bacterium]|nr:DUF1232 domain-containing protein [Sandaracinaceae bacterium]
MSDSDAQYVETFQGWLRGLPDDAEKLTELLGDESIPLDAREFVAGGLNYLFKSLDIVPDGIDQLGYLDDCFVLRVAASLALEEGADEAGMEALETLARLSNETESLEEFLGEDYQRLAAYVKSQKRGAARGRSVTDILTDEETREEFVQEVRAFAQGFRPPSLSDNETTLVKFRGFLDKKLPR